MPEMMRSTEGGVQDRTADEDLRIAAHEAGHAIVGWYNGRSIVTVTIEPDIGDNGKARNGHVTYGPPLDTYWNADLFARIVEDVARAVAERLHSYVRKPLRNSDKEKAYASAGALVTNCLATEILIASAEIEAEHILREHYPVLVAMAEELLRCRTMDGATALASIERFSREANGGSAMQHVGRTSMPDKGGPLARPHAA
jgi:hypothetical protein